MEKTLTNVQVGAGNRRLAGFVNIDIRRTEAVDFQGHAGDLRAFGDGSVRTLFSHAVLEHIYVGQHVAVMQEWRRVLADTGAVVCLYLPDFRAVCELYLQNGPGCIGERFDLFEAYRQTHGQPEHATPPVWGLWDPAAHLSDAPPGWLPQLHKCLLDANYLEQLLQRVGLTCQIFNYPYPGETPLVNLGFVATPTAELSPADAVAILKTIPDLGQFLDPATLKFVTSQRRPERMIGWADEMHSQPSISMKLNHKIARRLRKILGR